MFSFQLRYVIQSPAPLHDYRLDESVHFFRSWSLNKASSYAKKFMRELRSNEARMMGGRIRACKLYLQLPFLSRYFDIVVKAFSL